MATHTPDAVLIVDSDAAARTTLSDVLLGAGYACVEAATGEEGLTVARTREPALVVIADVLKGLASYEVCRALRDEFGELLPIIFVSRFRNEPLDAVAGLLLGADDYVVEPYAPEEFVARVRRAVTRAAAFRSISERPAHALTVREVEVLKGLASGLSQREIAQRLIISPKTVGTHIQRVLYKLDVHSRADAVDDAYQLGTVEPPAAVEEP